MNWKQIKWKIRYAWQYFPFTINSVLCLLAAWGVHWLLYKPTPKGETPSPFKPFILLMGKTAFIFLFALVVLSIFSTIWSYLHYLWLRARKGVRLQVEFVTETQKGKNNKLFLNARLDGVIRPRLGFVKARLFYDDNVFTGFFGLLSNKRKEQSLRLLAITGRSRLALPDIKEYDLKGGFIYFQDMLHLFRLASAQQVTGHFYQPPLLQEGADTEVFPKKTETMDVRIDQLRKVEGEQLNYKDFEAGDDVRRIVWKLYAKNRELVVRIPEMHEPYASHLYFYASFFAQVKAQWLGEGYLKEMLNYYKNHVWTIYDTLAHKEWNIRYIPDQTFHLPDQMPEDEKTARIISNSNWHKDTSLQQYFNPKNGTVLCISSLTDPVELRNLLDRCDTSTMVYFVKLSDVLRSYVGLTLIKRLIFLPPQDRLSKLRARWTFSPMRIQLHKREKEIEELLKRSNVVSGVL